MGTEPEMKIEKCDVRTKQRGCRTREDAQATTLKIHLFAFALHSVEQGRRGTSRKPKYIRDVLQLLYAACIRPIYRLASPRIASWVLHRIQIHLRASACSPLLSESLIGSLHPSLSLSLYYRQLQISNHQLNLISISPTHFSSAFHRNPSAYLENSTSTSTSNHKSTLVFTHTDLDQIHHSHYNFLILL